MPSKFGGLLSVLDEHLAGLGELKADAEKLDGQWTTWILALELQACAQANTHWPEARPHLGRGQCPRFRRAPVLAKSSETTKWSLSK